MIDEAKAVSILKDPSVTVTDDMVEKALITIVTTYPEIFLKINPQAAIAFYAGPYDTASALAAKYILPDNEKHIMDVAKTHIRMLADRKDAIIDKILSKCNNVISIDNANFIRIFDAVDGDISTKIDQYYYDLAIIEPNIRYMISKNFDVDKIDNAVVNAAHIGAASSSYERAAASWSILEMIYTHSKSILDVDASMPNISRMFAAIDLSGKQPEMRKLSSIINYITSSNHPRITELMRQHGMTDLTCRRCLHTAKSKSGHTLHKKVCNSWAS